ncbi:MAG: hypothetical protein NTZ35_04025, partial [Ignavibacteriales bacterium]|nr:hypothetical protein [Ignavibacteriales bacterium]
VNIPNRGAVPNLPDYALLEIEGVSDSGGVRGVYMGEAPLALEALLHRRIVWQELVADAAVKGIESVVKSYGYKNLELLEHLDATELKKIVASIDWTRIPQAGAVADRLEQLNKDIDDYFALAKRAFRDMYVRRMKVWSYLTSLAVVIALNANLFFIYQQFTSNAPLRDAAVSWAEKRVATPIDTTKPSASATDKETLESMKANVNSMREILTSDGFQVIGWNSKAFVPTCAKGWIWNWLGNVVGWFVMALLVSLGAPFWYDLLKTLMGVKDTLKPKTAAAEQKPKPTETDANSAGPQLPAVG